jgi:hypothetical protein
VVSNTAVIVLREGLEAVLILAVLMAGMVGHSGGCVARCSSEPPRRSVPARRPGWWPRPFSARSPATASA